MIEQKCLFWHIFAAQLKLQPNLLKEVHYALVPHADFQKNSCARINIKKRNHAPVADLRGGDASLHQPKHNVQMHNVKHLKKSNQ